MTKLPAIGRKAMAVAMALTTGLLPLAQAVAANYEYRVAYPGLGGGSSSPPDDGSTGQPPAGGDTGQGAGTGGGAAALVASTSTAVFGDVAANGTAYSLSVGLTNSGTAATASISATTSSPGYSVDGSACAAGLAAGASCALTVWFRPTTGSVYTGSVQVAGGTGAQLNIGLSGTGRLAQLTLSPASLTFAPARTGFPSNPQALTLTNGGNTAASLTGVGVSAGAGDFGQSNNCGTSLAAGASCAISVSFTASAAGSRTGAVSVVAVDAPTLTTTLAGEGQTVVLTLSQASLALGDVNLNRSSTVKTLSVQNPSDFAVAISGLGVVENGEEFAQSNTCGPQLAAHATCDVSVQFTPTTAGARTGSLALVSDAGTYTASLTGTGQAPAATLSAVAFSLTNVGSSTTLVSTLSNTGTSSIDITVPSSSSVSGADFSFVSTTCTTSLAASASCKVTVQFSPSAATARNGTLTVVTEAGTRTATLSGSGAQGVASLSASSLAFAAQQVATSSAQSVTVTNTGNGPLIINSTTVSSGAANYVLSGNCSVLAPGATCSVDVTFTPSTTGPLAGELSFGLDGVAPAVVTLSGTGQAASATLSTPSFAAAPVGSNTNAISTLTNNGVGPLSVTVPTSASVSGSDFSFVSTTCTASIAVSGSCTVTVKFSPTSTAARTGTLSIDTGAGTKTATLGSTGIQGYASINPGSLTFTAQQVASTSGVQTITVTNTGTNTLTFTGVGISTGATDYAQSNNCGAVAVNGTCTVNVSFTPSTTGTRTGTLAFTHNGGGIATVSLTGTGQAASATLSTLSFAPTPVGSSANATATLANTGVGPLTVTVPTSASVSGSDFSFVSTTCTASIAVSGTCTVTVKFSPTSTAARTGTLSIDTGAGTKTASLGSTGIQGYASISPGSLTFSAQQVASTSGVQTITVTNTGTNTLTFTGVGISAGATDYAQSNNCGAVAVNGTCTVNVSFTPSTTGTRTGTLAFTHNGGGIATVSLTGTGFAPAPLTAQIVFNDLNDVPVGTTSSGEAWVNFANNGSTTVTITGTTLQAPLSSNDNSCGGPLVPGDSCDIFVRVTPTSAGSFTRTVTVQSNQGATSVTVPFTAR